MLSRKCKAIVQMAFEGSAIIIDSTMFSKARFT